jgi:hypothetical protein
MSRQEARGVKGGILAIIGVEPRYGPGIAYLVHAQISKIFTMGAGAKIALHSRDGPEDMLGDEGDRMRMRSPIGFRGDRRGE